MPLYEYGCRACGHRFESLRRYEERLAPQSCPQCGEKTVTLAMSAPAMVGGSSGGTMADFSSLPASGGGCCGGGCGCSH